MIRLYMVVYSPDRQHTRLGSFTDLTKARVAADSHTGRAYLTFDGVIQYQNWR